MKFSHTGYIISRIISSKWVEPRYIRTNFTKKRGFYEKLALNDEILLNIEKPARYIGNEVNSVMKDKEKVDIRFAMCFPDEHAI